MDVSDVFFVSLTIRHRAMMLWSIQAEDESYSRRKIPATSDSRTLVNGEASDEENKIVDCF